jgi:protein gp37
MNSLKGLNRTTIPWVRNPDGTPGYTLSPITGCLNRCSYCYAHRLARTRCREHYLKNGIIAPIKLDVYDHMTLEEREADPFFPRIHPERVATLDALAKRKKPMGIFLCDMGELTAPWVPSLWYLEIIDAIRRCRQHRFYVLTKCYHEMAVLGSLPDNVWPGMSITDALQYSMAIRQLRDMKEAGRMNLVNFLSIEPLLENIVSFSGNVLRRAGVGWVVIGAATGRRRDLASTMEKYGGLTEVKRSAGRITLLPDIEWIRHIVTEINLARIPYFMKDELRLVEGIDDIFRQDMPTETWVELLITPNKGGHYNLSPNDDSSYYFDLVPSWMEKLSFMPERIPFPPGGWKAGKTYTVEVSQVGNVRVREAPLNRNLEVLKCQD